MNKETLKDLETFVRELTMLTFPGSPINDAGHRLLISLAKELYENIQESSPPSQAGPAS